MHGPIPRTGEPMPPINANEGGDEDFISKEDGDGKAHPGPTLPHWHPYWLLFVRSILSIHQPTLKSMFFPLIYFFFFFVVAVFFFYWSTSLFLRRTSLSVFFIMSEDKSLMVKIPDNGHNSNVQITTIRPNGDNFLCWSQSVQMYIRKYRKICCLNRDKKAPAKNDLSFCKKLNFQ